MRSASTERLAKSPSLYLPAVTSPAQTRQIDLDHGRTVLLHALPGEADVVARNEPLAVVRNRVNGKARDDRDRFVALPETQRLEPRIDQALRQRPQLRIGNNRRAVKRDAAVGRLNAPIRSDGIDSALPGTDVRHQTSARQTCTKGTGDARHRPLVEYRIAKEAG